MTKLLMIAALTLVLPGILSADPICKLKAGDPAVAPPAVSYGIKGSCERKRMCVMDILCKDSPVQKEYATSAVCLADKSGNCPSVSECIHSEGLDAAAAAVSESNRQNPSSEGPAAGSAVGAGSSSAR